MGMDVWKEHGCMFVLCATRTALREWCTGESIVDTRDSLRVRTIIE